MEDKYIILNLSTMDYFKDKEGNLKYFDSEKDAHNACWIHELPDAWICKLIYNYKEKQ